MIVCISLYLCNISLEEKDCVLLLLALYCLFDMLVSITVRPRVNVVSPRCPSSSCQTAARPAIQGDGTTIAVKLHEKTRVGEGYQVDQRYLDRFCRGPCEQ